MRGGHDGAAVVTGLREHASGRWPTGSTRLLGVIGDPVRHSLSPLLHNAAFAALGLDWAYVALPVRAAEVGQAIAGARALGLEGLNVTMPHKAAVLAHLDRVSPTVAALGSANTVVRGGSRRDELEGESTDGAGFLDALRTEEGFDPARSRCLVVGAGGAGRAVVLALAGAGARQVVVVNRRPSAALSAAALAGGVGRVGCAEEADAADLVVNATPLGMAGAGGTELPVPPERLGPGQVVVDLVYHPLRTPWLEAAAARGATTANGVGMLVHQAAGSLRLWTGAEAPLAAMREAIAGALKRPVGS